MDRLQGDISQESADALVNAAGTSLRIGSGVGGALRHGAGEQINEAAMEKGPVDLGEVAVTDAFDLDADYVVNVVSPAATVPLHSWPETRTGSYGSSRYSSSSSESVISTASTASSRCSTLVVPTMGASTAS